MHESHHFLGAEYTHTHSSTPNQVEIRHIVFAHDENGNGNVYPLGKYEEIKVSSKKNGKHLLSMT